MTVQGIFSLGRQSRSQVKGPETYRLTVAGRPDLTRVWRGKAQGRAVGAARQLHQGGHNVEVVRLLTGATIFSSARYSARKGRHGWERPDDVR